MATGNDSETTINPRWKTGAIVGYIAFVLGLLNVVAQASEAEAWPLNVSAAIVLVHMLAGFGIGWLVQPLLAKWFST